MEKVNRVKMLFSDLHHLQKLDSQVQLSYDDFSGFWLVGGPPWP